MKVESITAPYFVFRRSV